MLENVVTHGDHVRFAAFIGFLALVAALELLKPRRPLVMDRGARWVTNLGLLLVGTVSLRILQPLLALAAAGWAADQQVGLLAQITLPAWVLLPLGILVLDAASYGLHVLTHHVPVLWRFHAIHHSDRDVDLTTALRFHPVELVFQLGWKVLVIVAVGIDPAAVILFEILFSSAGLVNHGNFRLPAPVDRLLRLALITPDVHRIHHSADPQEMNRNYGFCLSIWDRIFGTFKAQPDDGHMGMVLGLPRHQDTDPGRFWWTMGFPFRRGSGQV
ncbi:MAG: sterol desaturase family protein [Alphaproteobacteria bacterium]